MQRDRFATKPAHIGLLFPLALAGLLVVGGVSRAQPPRQGYPSPHLQILTPNGGQAGTTVELTLSGFDLEEPEGLLFSQPGVKAERLAAPSPSRPDPRMRRPNPGRRGPLASTRFKVTIPANTPPGIHDVRLFNKWGVSNPRAFVVGDLPEVLEKEPNNDVDQAQRVALNSTVNGTISTPTDVDYYVFAGKKDQRVVASCLTSSIDSRLPAALELYGISGRMLASDRNYRGSDALLDCTLPADGDYQVRVSCFTYTQGSPQHFYRLSITTAPWIDAVYPPVVEPGKPTQVTVYGRNLPGGQPDPSAVLDGRVLDRISATIEPPREPAAVHRLHFTGHVNPKSSGLDGFEFRLRNTAGTSNPYFIAFAQAPVIQDDGTNDDAEHAQEIALPCEIAGRIEKRGDRDWYRFTAHKGEVYSIEAYADRLGAPIDLYFRLRNAAGQVIAQSADSAEILHPLQFYSRSDDPQRYRFTVPADGTYSLMVSSREAAIQSGPRDMYRVRITPERPDFRLIVMPPSLNSPEGCTLNRGGHQYYSVLVWRLDGFAGEVSVQAKDLPSGVTCPPQTIPGTSKQGVLDLTAAGDAAPWTGRIEVVGTATIGGHDVVREGRPATITWPVPPQQNLATISRLDRDLVLAVRDKAPFSLTAGTGKDLVVLSGQRVTVPLKVVRQSADFKGPVQVTAVNIVPGLIANNNQPLPIPAGKNEANVALNVGSNVPPGTYTLVFRGQAQVPVVRDARTKQKQNLALVQPSNPVLVTVLPRQVARLGINPGSTSLKPGQAKEVVVSVERLAGYDGDFKIDLVIPSGTKGIHAEGATIPKGMNKTRIKLEADEDAAPGNRGSLVVRATAQLKGQVKLTQEAKINVNVVK